MNKIEFQQRLSELTALPAETEWVEFKRNDSGNYSQIGEYISAIANSLALVRREKGYIVWGIDDDSHRVVGTNFKPRLAEIGKEQLENWLTRLLVPQVPFSIHEEQINGLNIVMIEVSPAISVPVRFSGEEFIRIGSVKKKLKDHPAKEAELWKCFGEKDWSAHTCDGATVDDLDGEAIAFARGEYQKKHPSLFEEVERWDDSTFLNKAKLSVNGRITRAALILLGKNESGHRLSPGIARMTWILKDADGFEKDYHHFGSPFILSVNQVLARIRNLTYRYLPDATLFPEEVTQYDPWVIREILHNCIAHQDYSLSGHINVVEEPESLLFTNPGNFLPGSVEDVIIRDAPLEFYRNRFLAEAMVNLNMIDTIGSGIKRMFRKQQERFFPMPDFDLSNANTTKVRLFGKIIDEKYTRMLKAGQLDLVDAIALDKVQKNKTISETEFKSLKRKKLIEGRRPTLFVTADIAAFTQTKAEYIKNRAFDKDYYKKMLVAYLEKFGEAKREDIDKLLLDKISDALNEDQKRNVVRNLLQEMRRERIIESSGTKRWVTWRIAKPRSKSDI